jgi:O-methyltransferase
MLKRIAKGMFNFVGLDVRRIRTHQFSFGITHVLLRPNATYAPWLAEPKFNETYKIIEHHTLVDLYRCYELWTLAGHIRHLPGDVIEIGVWRGGTGCLIAKRVQSLAANRTVYLCDTFSGVVGVGEKDTKYRGGEHADTSLGDVEQLVKTLALDNVRILQGIFPEETGQQITSNHLALVHIDVDVYNSALHCFEWAWPKLVAGGAVVFDDYGLLGCEGVTRMVNELDLPNCLIIYNLNGHALVVKCAVEAITEAAALKA